MSGKRKQTDLSHYFGSQQPANERNEVEHQDVDDDNESPPGGGLNAGIKNKLRNRLQPETVDMLMRISINGPDMFVEEKGELELSCKAAFVMKRAKELWLGAKPQGRRF